MANKKVTELTELTVPKAEDLFHVVNDVTGTPTNKKVRLDTLFTVANVKHFGAIGDGVTDDTAAIKSAIASIGQWQATGSSENLDVGNYGGGSIFFPSGDYLVTDTLLYTAGTSFDGEGKGTIIRFSPSTAIGLFEADPSYPFKSGTVHDVRWNNLSIIGDRNRATLAGNCTVGINVGTTVYGRISNCNINGWDVAIQANAGAGAASYYTKIESCTFIYNRRSVIQGTDGTVMQIVDSVFTKHASTSATVDYQIEAGNTIYMVGGSLEGGSIGKAHVYLTTGRFVCLGIHRDAGALQVEGHHDGIAESVTVLNALGSGSVLNAADILTDPTSWFDDDDTSGGYLIGNSGGSFSPVIKNGDFRYGLSNWTFNPSEGFTSFLQDRADVFGSDSGIYIEKTTTDNHAVVTQTLPDLREGDAFIACLMQTSSDALLNAAVTFRNDSNTEINAKFKRVVTFGDHTATPWGLYVAWIPYYRPTEVAGDDSVKIGLLTASPVGSWVKCTNLGVYTGGYPVIPTRKSVNETFSALPTQGHPKVGDKLYHSAPAIGTNQGWQCVKRSDTTLSSGTSASSAVIAVTDDTGYAVGDAIGVTLDNGQQLWSTIASGSGPYTLNDVLPSDAASGNKVTNHLYQAFGFVGSATTQTYTESNVSSDRSYDANSAVTGTGIDVADAGPTNVALLSDHDALVAVVQEQADVLGTLISDLRDKGIVK